MLERTVILYTFSKKFAMTGWRLGAAIAPVQIADVIAKLNTNDESCTAHFVQWAGLEGIIGDQSGPQALRDVLRVRRDAAVDATNAIPGMHTARPDATFYLFANVTEAMQAQGLRRRQQVRDGRAAPHRRVVLHPSPLRPAAAGRGRAVHPPGVLGHLVRGHRRGTGPAARLGHVVTAAPGWRVGTVVVTGKIPEPGLELLRGADHRVIAWDDTSAIPRDELLRRVAGADVIVSLLTEKIDAELLDAAGPQLRAVCNVAVGHNNIDVRRVPASAASSPPTLRAC